MTVHLLNENDNVPRFDRSAYHFDVPENNSSPRLLKVIEARDDDGDELTYSCDNKGIYTVKPVFSGHSKIDKIKVLKTGGSLMQVKSIAECSLGAFCNTFDLH